MVNPNDPRDRITTESFGVAPELLGLPLARPWRRAIAILADLIPVGILSAAGPFIFLACTAVVVVWRSLSGVGSGSWLRKGAAVPVRLVASLIAFVMVLQLGDVFDSSDGNRGNDRQSPVVTFESDDSIPVAVEEVLASLGITGITSEAERGVSDLLEENRDLKRQIRESDEGGDRRGGFMRWIANAADDLGIGFGWGALYFTTFTVLGRGQTPGKRLMGIRVIRLDGRPVGWWLAFERFGSYFASFSTGMLGFAQILWDRNRQALHDKAVETVVIRMSRHDRTVADRLNAARH